MWIGVISDTHGVLNPRVLDIFDGVDYILHCGDIGHPSIVDDLSQVAPVTGVLGTGDKVEDYPFEKSLYRRWWEIGVYINHRIGEPQDLKRGVAKDIETHNPQVILFGHTHESFNNRIDDRLFFNPGPAGRRKMKFPRSVGILEIEGQSVRGEIVPITPR